jgi:hypothetical protein
VGERAAGQHGRGGNRTGSARWAAWIVGLLSLTVALAGASVAAAESFGAPPGPDQSRCAALHGRQRILRIGQRLVLKAGPITNQCGGPPSRTHYAWETTDPNDPSAALGLQQVGRCAPDSPKCVYEAVMFTQPGIWESVGITGTSPDGGWGAGIGYAIRYGHYFEAGISTYHDHPKTVTMTGKGQRRTALPDQGWFNFAALPGTYTFSWLVHGRTVHHTVHLDQLPDKHLSVYFEPHGPVIERD